MGYLSGIIKDGKDRSFGGSREVGPMANVSGGDMTDVYEKSISAAPSILGDIEVPQPIRDIREAANLELDQPLSRGFEPANISGTDAPPNVVRGESFEGAAPLIKAEDNTNYHEPGASNVIVTESSGYLETTRFGRSAYQVIDNATALNKKRVEKDTEALQSGAIANIINESVADIQTADGKHEKFLASDETVITPERILSHRHDDISTVRRSTALPKKGSLTTEPLLVSSQQHEGAESETRQGRGEKRVRNELNVCEAAANDLSGLSEHSAESKREDSLRSFLPDSSQQLAVSSHSIRNIATDGGLPAVDEPAKADEVPRVCIGSVDVFVTSSVPRHPVRRTGKNIGSLTDRFYLRKV